MSRAGLGIAISLALFIAPLFAQYPLGAATLQWSGSSGQTAGSFCWESNWSCTPNPITVTANETVTLSLRGALGGAYVIAISGGASQCQVIPGVLNALVLDNPITPVITGQLNIGGAILACPAGTDSSIFSFPSNLPPGMTFAIQALITGAGNMLTFSEAILVTTV